MDAQQVIDRLGLAPHPEGGHFRETWRHEPGDGARGAATAIYFLLAAGESSAWHRVDADELWLFHAGAPLQLDRSPAADVAPDTVTLGADLVAGQEPQRRIPAGWWQAARSLGDWSLVSCVVAPAFSFDGFELAPPGFRPGTE